MNRAVLFSSAKDDWRTPVDLFIKLTHEFGFGLDVAARLDNSLCRMFFSDALETSWKLGDPPVACWCNPPYSRGLQGKFIAKAASERLKGVTTVMLLPARTDTRAFHSHIWDASRHQPREGVEVRFLPGRIKFVDAAHGAPFPSMIVVFRGAK